MIHVLVGRTKTLLGMLNIYYTSSLIFCTKGVFDQHHFAFIIFQPSHKGLTIKNVSRGRKIKEEKGETGEPRHSTPEGETGGRGRWREEKQTERAHIVQLSLADCCGFKIRFPVFFTG